MSNYSKIIIECLQQVFAEKEQCTAYQLHTPYFDGNEKKYLNDCIDTGWVSSVGSYVDKFEEALASFTGMKHAVLLSNGTVALQMGLLVAGVEQNDEVLVPAMSFVASANAISHIGAVPHFCDIENDTLGIDADKLDLYLHDIAELKSGILYNKNTNRRIKAIMPVHIFGHSCKIDEILAVAEKYCLEVVEDASEALGSYKDNKHVGHHGTCSIFSFNGNKIMTTGGGGCVVTNDEELASRIKHLATTAKQKHLWHYEHDMIGFNYRLPNINAALGLAQLEQMEFFLQKKRALAVKYKNIFKNVEGIDFLEEPPSCKSNYWLNTIIIRDKNVDRKELDRFLSDLHNAGYHVRPVWRLLHQLPMYQNNPRMDTSMADSLVDKIINLPSSVEYGV